jgi:hypothetical protein
MSYRIHKVSAKIAAAVGIAVVIMQCVGNAIRDWQFSSILPLVWGSIPPMLIWFFLTFKRPERRRIDPDNPFWEAAGDDYIKAMVVGTVMLALEFVFRH